MERLSLWLVLSLVLSGILAMGCGGASKTVSTGIAGSVFKEIAGGAAGSAPRDIPITDAVVTVQTTAGQTVAQQATDKNGMFRVQTPPGIYQVSATETSDASFTPSQSVTVTAGTETQIVLKQTLRMP